jgi:hypothetical protein
LQEKGRIMSNKEELKINARKHLLKQYDSYENDLFYLIKKFMDTEEGTVFAYKLSEVMNNRTKYGIRS